MPTKNQRADTPRSPRQVSNGFPCWSPGFSRRGRAKPSAPHRLKAGLQRLHSGLRQWFWADIKTASLFAPLLFSALQPSSTPQVIMKIDHIETVHLRFEYADGFTYAGGKCTGRV